MSFHIMVLHLSSKPNFSFLFQQWTNFLCLDTIVISIVKYACLQILSGTLPSMFSKDMIAPPWDLQMTRIVTRLRSTWTRYIGSVESCWHMFEFPIHFSQPTVYRLPVHLEDQQIVYYNPDDNPNDVLERGATKETLLTAWFKINQSNPSARNTTYQNFPQIWVFDSKKKAWKPRVCGKAIGCMYFASPSSGERFYL